MFARSQLRNLLSVQRGHMAACGPARTGNTYLARVAPVMQHEKQPHLCTPSLRAVSTSPLPRHPAVQSPSSASPLIDFSNVQEAYKSKSTADLWRSVFIFKLCSWKGLVDRSEMLIKLSTRVLGGRFTDAIVRATFFRHFCAGEDGESIRPVIQQLREYGVGGILDYAAEADLQEEEEIAIEDITAAGDVAAPNQPARVYDYTSERACDANTDIFLECIRAVRNAAPEGFAAIKVTALGNPKLLERMSTCIVETRKLFDDFANDEGFITREDFHRGYDKYFHTIPSDRVDRVFDALDYAKDGTIDVHEWVNQETISGLMTATAHCREEGPVKRAALSEEETVLMLAMDARLKKLADEAQSLGVRLMVDAEQSYFQPAIDLMVLDLQRKYNKNGPIIFTTIQCYLKGSKERMLTEIDRSQKEDFFYGVKLVRGAYMVAERARAKDRGYPSPVFDTKEDTHASFNDCVETTLANIDRVNVLVASHNQQSVELTLELMKEKNVHPREGGVYFGQLLGMADHLTFNLGQNNYNAYKYVPYGPVREVVPYLIRRGQENSDMMGGVGEERRMMWDELKRRRYGLGL